MGTIQFQPFAHKPNTRSIRRSHIWGTTPIIFQSTGQLAYKYAELGSSNCTKSTIKSTH